MLIDPPNGPVASSSFYASDRTTAAVSERNTAGSGLANSGRLYRVTFHSAETTDERSIDLTCMDLACLSEMMGVATTNPPVNLQFAIGSGGATKPPPPNAAAFQLGRRSVKSEFWVAILFGDRVWAELDLSWVAQDTLRGVAAIVRRGCP